MSVACFFHDRPMTSKNSTQTLMIYYDRYDLSYLIIDLRKS